MCLARREKRKARVIILKEHLRFLISTIKALIHARLFLIPWKKTEASEIISITRAEHQSITKHPS